MLKMSTTEEQMLPIIPFGKYKGQSVTSLLNDVKYLEWCKQQEWFQKYPVIYNICVNQTITNVNQSSKTPEHNKLQNKFMDLSFRQKILKTLDIELFGEEKSVKFEDKFNWDVVIRYDSQGICFEIKPLLGDDYPCVLRKLKSQRELTRSHILNNRYKGDRYKSDYKSYVSAEEYNLKRDKKFDWERIEIVLVVGEFSSKYTSREQLLAIFNQEKIRVIFTDELGIESNFIDKDIKDINDMKEEIRSLRQKLQQAEEKIKQQQDEIRLKLN
jgi:hypothetical protein